MVGRTPEYLGKTIQAREIQMAMLYVLIFPRGHPRAHGALVGAAAPGSRASTTPGRTGCPRSSTPSARPPGNNGSAFAGLTGSTYCYNTLLGLAMLIGRFAHDRADGGAGRLPRRAQDRARDRGHLPVTTPLFVVLLIGVILIVGALTFFPALSLGPIVEHFLMHGRAGGCSLDPWPPSEARPAASTRRIVRRRARVAMRSYKLTRGTCCGTR